jgi:serine/threonine protein phosphatase PrpC
MSKMKNWCSAEQSHRGNRRKNNEDAVLSRPDVGLWAVADGMGGHQAGDVASQACTNALATVRLVGSGGTSLPRRRREVANCRRGTGPG